MVNTCLRLSGYIH